MKILYFNIFEGCKEKGLFKKLIDFINKQDPDIVALSELNDWDKKGFYKLEKFKELTKFKEHIFCPSKSGFHLAIFSKYKVENGEVITKGFNTGAIIAELKANDFPIKIIITHLDYRDEDRRLKELDRILDKCGENDRLILLGDLNSVSPQDKYPKGILSEMKSQGITKFGSKRLRKEVISRIIKAGFTDSIIKFHKSFEFSVPTPFNLDKDHFTKLRLDYIFVKNLSKYLSGAKTIRNRETDHISDHYPIMAEFNFNK